MNALSLKDLQMMVQFWDNMCRTAQETGTTLSDLHVLHCCVISAEARPDSRLVLRNRVSKRLKPVSAAAGRASVKGTKAHLTEMCLGWSVR